MVTIIVVDRIKMSNISVSQDKHIITYNIM